MKVVIIGGTGLIGSALSQVLKKRGEEILLISRYSESAKLKNIFADNYFTWDYKSIEYLIPKINGFEAVINLAGAPISGRRWNKKYMEEIRNSRITTTSLLADAICKCNKKTNVFISASAAGYYGNGGETILTENSSAGNDFLSNVCSEWENASEKVTDKNVRLVLIRTGIVLAKEGGALKRMLLPFKLFLGGPLGNGKQWFPWIHINDEVNAILFALDNVKINGPLNITAPTSIRMNDFAKVLGKLLKRPSFFKVPKIVLRIVTGKIADNLVLSQRVYPQKLIDNGYRFQFAVIDKALEDLVK